jgi:hypothetical protein
VTEHSDAEVVTYEPVASDADRLPAQERAWLQELITAHHEKFRRALPPPKLDADGEDRPHESPFDEINLGSEWKLARTSK